MIVHLMYAFEDVYLELDNEATDLPLEAKDLYATIDWLLTITVINSLPKGFTAIRVNQDDLIKIIDTVEKMGILIENKKSLYF